MIKETKWKYFFIFLIVCDIIYTYIQNSNTMLLDGDMAGIILPIDSYKKVLTDPFGLSVFLHNETYASPNRFFIHFFMQKYFQIMPFFLQKFTNPINSLFLSNIIPRTLIQVILIYLISALVSGSRKIWNSHFLVAAILITPLFQVNGYNISMGISLNSITYTFFYSLPLIFILLYFFPFVEHFYHGKPLFKGCLRNQLMILLAFIIALGGPLGAPIVLLIVTLIFSTVFISRFRNIQQQPIIKKLAYTFRSIPVEVKAHFAFITLLSIYSLYLGTHNSENMWNPVTVKERYHLLGIGMWSLITKKLGVPLLLVTCIINSIFVYRLKSKNSAKAINLIRLLAIFSVIYILLLPLGGYRFYRPYIVRCDTFSPVTIAMMIVFALTFIMLLSHYQGRIRNAIICVVTVIALIYTNADRYEKDVNKCQKDYLKALEYSSEEVVELHGWCSLLTWDRIKDPKDSQVSSKLLQYWNITKGKKLHYHDSSN